MYTAYSLGKLGARLEKANEWITLLTNVGVLVGLVILVYEVNQNTNALQNETDVAVYTMAMDNRHEMLENSSLRELYARGESDSLAEFTSDEQLSLLLFWASELDRTELQFGLFKRNGIDLENVVFYERDLVLEPFKKTWLQLKKYYDPEFVTFFDGLIAKANGNP